MNLLYRITLSVFISVCSLPAFCQSGPIDSLINRIDLKHKQLPVEKLYLQLDKPNYAQNDTLWFKAYLLNADDLTASTRSGLLYIELSDSHNTMVKRMICPVVMGLSWGNIALNVDEIPEGSYTLRAYTNWMRNFGEDYVFKKQIYIASSHPRLINSSFKETQQEGITNIQAGLLFTDLSKNPVRLQDMQLRVTDGQHTLYKASASTDMDGKVNVNFNLPDKTSAKNLSIILHDKVKGADTAKTYEVPIIFNQPQNIDLQFMPEGGALVTGITSRIGFKAIGEDGKGIDISGKIYDSKQQEVTAFESVHSGVGSFNFTPLAGNIYTAQLTSPDGNTKSYPMPVISQSGVCLRVDNRPADSLRVIISITPDLLANRSAVYYLIGQSGGVVCYAAHITMKSTELISLISKNAFPSGIAHLTLLNEAVLPLAERIVYINHNDNLQLNIITNKNNYAPHDSVALNIKVTDKAGKPVIGSFSMSVTDDGQVKNDSLDSNILNDMLLTSDLKGNVEQPAYYFEDNSPERAVKLDNLLLTQGWVGYNWKQLFLNKVPAFAAEPEFRIQGRVTNIFNKPIAGSQVTLLSKKPAFITDTVTDKDGRFVFKGFLPVDTASFMIQVRNKRGKSNNVGVTVDEFKAPVFTQANKKAIPWYVNTDTLMLKNLNNRVIKQLYDEKIQGLGHKLKEVVIKDKKIIKNSKNMNGPGEADQILNEQDILKANKMTLVNLLKQKVKGFNEGYMLHDPNKYYKIYDARTYFVIDGFSLDKFYNNEGVTAINDYFHFMEQNLDYFTAEDITGIEVMFSSSYSSSYIGTFVSPFAIGDIKYPRAFIEITTRWGHGPFVSKTPGTYLYKPLPVSLPKQFYRPKYNVKSAVTGADLRSTVHWQPNIVTDTAGRATVSFYTADKPATYTIILEGVDLNGAIGVKRSKLLMH